MNELSDLLSWNISARDPLVFMTLTAVVAVLTLVLMTRPRLYFPLLIFTAPLPKLFTLTEYATWNNKTNASGFSIADLVLAAGLLALLLRGGRRSYTNESAAFGRALIWWSASVLFSVLIGLVLWQQVYDISNSVYALRYIITLSSYAVGARYAVHFCDDNSVRKVFRYLIVAGNLTLALGLVYYFFVGSSNGGSQAIALFDADSTVFRSYLFFFDYAIDMGYFAATIAILNLIALSDPRISYRLRILSGFGIGFSVIAILLLGERVNLLVLVVSLGYFLFESGGANIRSVRVSALFRIACLLAVAGAGIGAMRLIAPHQMSQKFDNLSESQDASDASAVLDIAGVPPNVSNFVLSLPIGDFAVRLALSVAGIWFFVHHPLGVGFWGELPVMGWYSHHEIVKIAIEQSLQGLLALVLFVVALKRLLWKDPNRKGPGGQLGILLRSISFGLFAAMLASNTVLLDLKYAMVYWTLVGIWSVLPNQPRQRMKPLVVREYEPVPV